MSQHQWILIVIIASVCLDQGSKVWASSALSERERVAVIDGVIELRLRHNPGVAWGLGEGLPLGLRRVLFPALGLVIGLVMIVWTRRLPEDRRLVPVGVALVLGGGIGNAVDRLRAGAVIDFIGVDVGSERWTMSGTFNIADAAMVVGVALIVVGSRGDREEREGTMGEGGSA